MKTYSFLNMKGGVGKTTSSVNISAGLAERGKKVLLVDFDPQANTTSMFLDEEPELSISDLLFNTDQAKEAIISVKENLGLIPATLELAASEMKLKLNQTIPQHNRLKKILDQVKNDYDYCIIDCPPIINTLTINAIIASDTIVVPIKPEKFAVSGFQVTINTIKEISEGFDITPDCKILFTMINRNNTDREVISQLHDAGVFKIYDTQIRYQSKPVTEASLENKLLIEDKKAGVADDYRTLVEELLNE